MGPKETQKGGPGPPKDPRTEVQGPSRAQFSSFGESNLDVFQYHSRPPFDYAELCSLQYTQLSQNRTTYTQTYQMYLNKPKDQTNEAYVETSFEKNRPS